MTSSTTEQLPVDASPGQRLLAVLLRTALKTALRPAFQAGVPVARQRERLLAVARLTLPPRAARFEQGTCGGVPGEWVAGHGAAAPRSILYLHGGAYCVGSPRTHRVITGQLALRAEASVFCADYRLAPEHPFPAAVDDAVAAYRGLLALGRAPAGIAIAGDSAGGGLAFATVLRLRELGVALPGALVAFSPWVDLDDRPRPAPAAGDVMIAPAWVAECARLYLAGASVDDPLASPVHADLHGLPRTLIQVGTDEVLLDDSRRMHARLIGAGVDSRLEEYPRRWHVFQASAGLLADANRALARVAQFLRDAG